MLTQHFYHEKIRKCVSVFGTLFNNIYLLRKDSSGSVISQIKVPLSYSPKQKYLDRIRETEDMADAKLAIKLPRMGFEMSSLYFDPTRQLPKTNNFSKSIVTDNNKKTKFFTSVPYILNFQLSILAKTNEDAVQILEQVIPYFNPSYTITMKQFADYPDVVEDIPISLIGISFSDDYEGQLENRRTSLRGPPSRGQERQRPTQCNRRDPPARSSSSRISNTHYHPHPPKRHHNNLRPAIPPGTLPCSRRSPDTLMTSS